MCVRVIRAEAHALVELGNYKLRSRPWIVVDWPVSVQFGARAKHKNQSRGLLLTRLWLYVYTYNNNTGLGWAGLYVYAYVPVICGPPSGSALLARALADGRLR